MIASLLHALYALVTLLASWHDQPAPEPLPAPAVTEGARPTTPHYAPPADPAPAVTPVEQWPALPWESWPSCSDLGAPPDACVQEQLPDETIGRALD